MLKGGLKSVSVCVATRRWVWNFRWVREGWGKRREKYPWIALDNNKEGGLDSVLNFCLGDSANQMARRHRLALNPGLFLCVMSTKTPATQEVIGQEKRANGRWERGRGLAVRISCSEPFCFSRLSSFTKEIAIKVLLFYSFPSYSTQYNATESHSWPLIGGGARTP